MSKVSFNYPKSPFFTVLSERVEAYFKENKINSTGNYRLFSKAIFLFSLFVTFYVLLLTIQPGWISVILCIGFGLNFAAIGFNIMHDGAHGSFSQKKWLNEICAYTLNIIGGSSFMWKIKHNIIHHSFVNIEEVDDDIDIQPWMRVSHGQRRYWFHKFQYFYWIILYGVTFLLWVLYLDYQKYFSRKIASYEINKISLKEHFIFWGSKLAYLFVYFVIPIYFVGFANWMIGYLIMSFVTGLTISVVFQLAHVIEDVEFPKLNDQNKIDNEWAVHQVETTADFSTKNKFVTWFLGGLNFQVVHHLFPKVSHVHYPKLQKIVKETCDQFQVKYMEYKSVWAALRSHVRHLKLLGAK